MKKLFSQNDLSRFADSAEFVQRAKATVHGESFDDQRTGTYGIKAAPPTTTRACEIAPGMLQGIGGII